jgi:hypothetical protein
MMTGSHTLIPIPGATATIARVILMSGREAVSSRAGV